MRAARVVLAAALVGAVGVIGAGVGSSVDAAPKGKCNATIHDGVGKGWRGIEPPFSEGPQKITQVVNTPYQPDQFFVTNGTQVLQTVDAGCNWVPNVTPEGGTLGLLPEPLDGLIRLPSDAHVTAIAAPSSGTGSTKLYIGYNVTTALGTRPHVIYLDGKTFGEADGLPNMGSVQQLAAVDTLPNLVYALIDPANGLVQDGGLYASGDGGANFAQRNANARSADLAQLTTDPLANTLVYARNDAGLTRSIDGGRNFTAGPKLGADITSFDVSMGSGSVRMVVNHKNARVVDTSDNAGQTWSGLPTPIAADEVALEPIVDQVGVSDSRSVWLVSRARTATDGVCPQRKLYGSYVTDVTPKVGGLTQLQFSAPSVNGYSLSGLSKGGALMRGAFSLNNCNIKGKGLAPVELLPQVLPHRFPSTLTPGRTTVTLPPGGHEDVTYRLLLPRTPSPIDVMFLVDTTDSTEHTIAGLRNDLGDIVNDLATIGLDVQFGLADFRDYPPTVADKGDGEIGDYPYKLRQKIGLVDDGLRNSLSQLRAAGGGDPAEADLTALYQSTTGDGQPYPGHRRGFIKNLEPGQSAGYRANALRLAVLATDNRFHDERNYLTPTWEETVSALLANRVHPIGLAVQTVDNDGKPVGFSSLRDESRLATDTRTFAPRGGVDCNGDLVVDLPANDPFVCKIPMSKEQRTVAGVPVGGQTESVKLAPAITTAAEALPDYRNVGLTFHGATSIAQVVSPVAFPQVNLKNDNTVDYKVRFTCPKAQKPRTYHVGVTAGDGFRLLASSAAKVACGAVPVPPKDTKRLPPPEAAVALAAPAANAPAPPPPGQPIPNPNPNPNPNPALNANVGFASQEEEQRQLAFAGADMGVEEDTTVEMSMSRLGGQDDTDSAAYLLGGAAVLMAGAAGYAARTRLRSRYAVAWNHRR